MNSQKGNIAIIVGLVVVVVLVAVLFLSQKNLSRVSTQTATTRQTSAQALPSATPLPVPNVTKPQDLNTVSNMLDNTNINSIDTTVSQNSSDTTGF